MGGFVHGIVRLAASPAGVFVLAALDSTIFVSLPFGLDAAVIVLAANLRGHWWVVPLLATAGSVAGAAFSYWMGHKVGDEGLERFVDGRRLDRLRTRVRDSGAVALAVLDLLPPPFPFTPFVLAAGALEVSPRRFFLTLLVCRLLRFGVESALARRYGGRIIAWMDAPAFRDVVIVLAVLAVGLTVVSGVKLLRSSRAPSRRAAA